MARSLLHGIVLKGDLDKCKKIPMEKLRFREEQVMYEVSSISSMLSIFYYLTILLTNLLFLAEFCVMDGGTPYPDLLWLS